MTISTPCDVSLLDVTHTHEVRQADGQAERNCRYSD